MNFTSALYILEKSKNLLLKSDKYLMYVDCDDNFNVVDLDDIYREVPVNEVINSDGFAISLTDEDLLQ